MGGTVQDARVYTVGARGIRERSRGQMDSRSIRADSRVTWRACGQGVHRARPGYLARTGAAPDEEGAWPPISSR